ncbi:hypothetical protein RJ639_043604 [Escallonia herrerae]|uniref:Retrotransposon gag domain-containing protein n=1 Tax=Escallonia herrerae TaxID=1293975 RepID=A0AA88WC10_9ASTE|nr:hypothetical protein RJ639_043604 [Escallonia herrerae]
MPTTVQIPPPADMGTALPLLFSFPSAGPSRPPIPVEMTTAATHTAPAPGSTQVDLFAIISTMQKSIEKLQAAIEQRSEPHLDQATHTNTQKQPVRNCLISSREERHEGAGMYTNDLNQHFIHIDDEESDDERRNPRLRRQENSYETPIRGNIEFFPTPANFKMPQCNSYDGTGDPMEHLARFTSCMNLHLVPDQIMCWDFPVTLKGAVHAWFQHLTPCSISCWAQLAESFRGNFLKSRIQRKNSSALFRIVQGPKESLKSYYARFNTEKLLIDHLDSGVTFAAMARGVRPGTPLRFLLNKRPPENMTDLLDRVEKYLRAEEDSAHPQEEPSSNQKRQGQNILKWPKPMRMLADKRDDKLYCHFYKDHGHTTEECKVLQREIESLINKGHLRQFVKTNNRQGHRGNQRKPEEAQPKDPPVINTISGGPSAGGLTNSSRKAYAQQVNLTQGLTKRSRTSTSLEFNDSDLEGVICPHDDALVITLQVDAYSVKCILVDTGSSADIIFEEAFSHMGISKERVKPISSPLYGFTGASAPVEGIIPLTIIVGTAPLQSVQTIDFLVVKVKSSYNGILGRTGLNKLRAVASTYHLAMKFPTPQGVGVVKGDQATAQKCYITSCKIETFNIDDQRDEQVMKRTTPIQKLEYLASTPLLSKPIAGEMLFLYLAITDFAISAVLVREEDSKQFPIYYVRKVLQGAELRYPTTEKLAFSHLIAARKLRLYFQSHTITVLIDKPLRRILHKPDLSGRLVPWSVELGEFDIQYKPRPSIKGQALADFIVKCTLPIDKVESHVAQPEVFAWMLYVDGSSNTMGSGVGLPSARVITYNPDTNDAGLRGNLDLLDEMRDQAAMCLAAYQHRVAKFFDNRVRSRAFCIGDLVLR